jgi:hypothetical protein
MRASRAEQFREHAANCLRLAAVAQDQQAQAVLMHMAEAWIRLAAATPAASGSQEKKSEPSGSEER